MCPGGSEHTRVRNVPTNMLDPHGLRGWPTSEAGITLLFPADAVPHTCDVLFLALTASKLSQIEAGYQKVNRIFWCS